MGLHECELEGYLMRSVSNLYNGSRACMRSSSRVGEYFEVRRRLRQGCVMFTWLFDKVVREVN